jgi:hypothetical protein
MASVGEISQLINGLQVQDVRRSQKAVHDEQLRGIEAANAEHAAVGQQYTAMVQAFRDNGGNIDALAPMVRDQASMKAFASFVTDYSQTEEGRKKAMDATMERTSKMFQVGSGYIQKALASPKGSPEWVANVQNAAAAGPFPFKLGGYDQASDSFELLDADPVSGFVPSGERMPAGDVDGVLRRIQSGTISSKDGKLWNREWQQAQIMFDVDRKQQNSAFLMDDSKHVILTKGNQTMRAVPQISENPADGYVYLLQDPQRGLVPMRDLSALLNDGWRPTNQAQLNKETEYGLDRQKLGMQALGHEISAGNLALNERKYSDAQSGIVSPKEQSTVTNTAIDNLRARQNDILRAYADFPDVSGMDQNLAMMTLNKAKTVAVQNLERAAMAEGADPRARRDYQEFMKNEQDYQQLLDAGTGLAFGMVGQERPADPAAQAAAAGGAALPGEAAGRGLAPVAGLGGKWGARADGTEKGDGFFGPLQMTDGSGSVATEISVGVNIDGREMEIPTLVPTLTPAEKDHLLSGNAPTQEIVRKAVDHARERISVGKSPFAQPGEGAGGQAPAPVRSTNPGQQRFKVGEATKEDVRAEFVALLQQGKSKEEAKQIIKKKYQGQ